LARYRIRGPKDSVHTGDHPSVRTETITLAAIDWAAPADASDATFQQCPRGFVPAASGVLVFQAMGDSADGTIYVNAGQLYPIALKSITQASCATALKIAAAICVLY
jgi:hypothetical protein